MDEAGPSRKERERLSRRNDIIAAARDVFTTHGFTEATLEEIATRAEYGKGTLYNYFEGKDDLYAAVLTDCFDQCTAFVEEAFSGQQTSFLRASKRFATAVLRYFFMNPGLVSLLMRELHMPHEHMLVRERLSALVRVVEHSMEAAVRRQEIKPCRTDKLAFLFIGHIFTLFHNSTNHACCMGGSTDEGLRELSEADIQAQIQDVMEMMDMTFYTGVLQA